MNTVRETIPHDESDDIPVSLLVETNIELSFNRSSDEKDFIEVAYAEEDDLFAKLEDPKLSSKSFEPIGVEDILKAQL